jgi:hypothetical protein
MVGVAIVAGEVGGAVIRLVVGVTRGFVCSTKTENVVCTPGAEAEGEVGSRVPYFPIFQ